MSHLQEKGKVKKARKEKERVKRTQKEKAKAKRGKVRERILPEPKTLP